MSIYYDARNKRYRFSFNQVVGGKRVRATKLLPAAWNKADAQKFDVEETARIFNEHKNPGEKRHLISDAVILYVKHRCPELKDGAGITKELARLYDSYAGRYLDELSDVGKKYREAESARLKPASIKNKLSYLRAACRYAQEHHGFGNPNLKLSISMPSVDNAREVYITRAEMLQIARKIEDRTSRAVLRVAFYSGMRIGEIIKAGETIDQMKRYGGFLLLNTKNKSSRVAPAHPRVRVMLKYFPLKWKKAWIQRLIRRAMDQAGFEHVRLHDVRHSTASALINSGVDLFTVGRVLGHKDARSTARYSHLKVDTLNNAVLQIK